MEARLLPLNAVVGLVTPHGLNPAVLHNAGFRLVGLETPMAMTDQTGRVTVDAVLLQQDTNHLLLCEAKSGANIVESQAARYAALDPSTVVQAAYVTLPRRIRPTSEVVYVCLGDHLERVKHGLIAAGTAFPILALHEDEITLVEAERAGSALRRAFESGPVSLRAPIAEILPFDQDSSVEVIRPAVEAELIACLTHRLPQITFAALSERIAPYLGFYGHGARKRFVKQVGAACREVAETDPGTFAIDLPGSNREGMLRFLRTPEQYDTRGRTPAYQSLLRRSQRVGPSAQSDQLDLLDLLEEVDNGDEDKASGEEGDR